jgi:hypothetical protein
MPEEFRPDMRTFSNIEAEHIQWLWPLRFAQGKLHQIVGNAGLGKSTLTTFMAAQVSTGGEWPDDSGNAPQGDVILLSAEDDAADTIKPRIVAAGGDPSRIHILDGIKVFIDGEPKSMEVKLHNIEILRQAIEDHPDTKLIVIDPVACYLGKADGHKEQDVRQLLSPLAQLAKEKNVCIVLVNHFNKAGAMKAIHRATGSQGFTNAVRFSWAVVADPDNAERRFFVRIKGNVAEDVGALCFGIVKDDDDMMPHIEWVAGSHNVNVDALMSYQPDSDSSALDEAKDFVRTELADGAVAANELHSRAKDYGISQRTLKRARTALSVQSERRVVDGKPLYWCSLPDS